MYNINLLPPELQKEASVDINKLKKMLFILILGMLTLGGYGGFLFALHLKNSELNEIQSQIVALEPKAAKIDEYIKEQKLNAAKINVLEQLLRQRVSFYQVLRDINNNLPTDLNLTKIDVNYLDKITPGGFSSAGILEAQGVVKKPGETTPPQQPSGGQGQNAQTPQGNQNTNPPANAQTAAAPKQDPSKPVPNRIVLEGLTQSTASVGVLVNNLKNLPYFKYIKLESVSEDKEYPQLHKFIVHAYMIGAEAGAAASK